MNEYERVLVERAAAMQAELVGLHLTAFDYTDGRMYRLSHDDGEYVEVNPIYATRSLDNVCLFVNGFTHGYLTRKRECDTVGYVNEFSQDADNLRGL